MSTAVQKIKSLIPNIPARDIRYATECVEERDFEARRELVKSDIHILMKKKDSSMENQISILEELKAEIDAYLLLLGLDDNENEIDFWGE